MTKVLCGYVIRDDHFEGEGAVVVEVHKFSGIEKAFNERMASLNHKKAFAPRKIETWYMSWYLPQSLAFGRLKVVGDAEIETNDR